LKQVDAISTTEIRPSMSAFEKLRARLSRYIFVILAAGSAICSVISSWLAPRILGSDASLLTHLFADGAIIFLAAELVERTLLSNFNREANTRTEFLGDTLSDKIESVLNSTLADYKYAEHYHVHLLPPRRSKSKREEAYQKIGDAIQEAKWIKVLCTSGSDIFENGHLRTKLEERIIKPPWLSTTVLSCRPGGRYANVRSTLEGPTSDVSSDVDVSLKRFKQLAHFPNGKNLTLRWLHYDFVPQGWFFLTDKGGFAEFYHFGRQIVHRGTPSLCMGGRVPLLSFSPQAGMYEALNEYLSYLAGDESCDKDAAAFRTDYFNVEEVYKSAPP
jgi:hypothetical protein